MVAFAHFDARHPVRDALCLSAFLVALEREAVLVGRMQDPEAWRDLDAVQTSTAFREGRWVLPAAHLRVGEDPGDAARRIATDQLRAPLQSLQPWRVLSYAGPLEARGEERHWDLCFVYRAELEPTETPPWFAELRRVPLADLRAKDFARGHGEILECLHLFDPSRDG